MINLIFTVAGLILVLGGLYVMTLGFTTPPSIVMFMCGLLAFVVGAIMMVLFAGKINLKSGNKSKPEKQVKKEQPVKRSVKEPVKPVESVRSRDEVKESVKPVEPVKPVESVRSRDEVKESVKPIKDESEEKSVGEIRPKRVRRTFKSKEPNQAKIPRQKPKKQSKPEVSKGPTNLFSKLKEKASSSSSKNKAAAATATAATAEVASESKKPKRPNPKRRIPNPKKKSATPRPTGPKSKDTGDNSYVAKRLNMLKQEYVEGIGDVDKFIDEKIGSLNETTNVASNNLTPKTISSGGSNLIWSFESFDVQDSLKDTLTKSKSRLVMMYPWIRNIDVGILKKFMDTDSRLIIQEAGLDDDASVELIKLLMDNGVEIRTMPHIHTVAAVSDEDEGLIISTDPIYDSFEVGVKYTDSESIKQINNLFEEAWKLSNPIEL